MGDMTLHFSRHEFACKCGCGLDAIDPELVDNLQHSRSATGISYTISSGCRCYSRNVAAGGKYLSAHLKGTDGLCHAADIVCEDSSKMYFMMRDLIRRFRRVEAGKKVKNGNVKLWIHVDNSKTLPQDVFIIEVVRED